VIAGLVWLGRAAAGGVIAVPADAETLALAVQLAVDGDVIELSPGDWLGPGAVPVSLTIVGVGGAADTTVRPDELTDQAAFDAHAPLVLQGLTLADGAPDGSAEFPVSGTLVVGQALTLSDVIVHQVGYGTFSDGGAAVVAYGDLSVTDATFDGTSLQGSSILAWGGAVSLDRVSFTGGAYSDGAAVISLAGGSLSAIDVVFSSLQGGPLISATGATSATLTRVRSCGAGSIQLSAEQIAVDATQLTGGLVLTGDAVVRNSVLDGGGAFAIAAEGTLAVWSTAFVGQGGAVGGTARLSGGYDLFQQSDWPADLSIGAVTGASGLVPVAVVDEDDICSILAPGAGSPTIDAGDPATPDRNGTRSDIAATGGPVGYVVDADGDGWKSDVDCADASADIHPGAAEVPYDGIDQDCDGADLDDVDGDGFPLGPDCNDADAGIGPGQPDPAGDGIDQDCDGEDGTDATDPGVDDLDGDGYVGADDCDDADPEIHPGAAEDAGPLDRDCDGWSDPAQPFEPRGCSSGPGMGHGGGLGLMIGGALLARRRRCGR
jgi:hypothetical protein